MSSTLDEPDAQPSSNDLRRLRAHLHELLCRKAVLQDELDKLVPCITTTEARLQRLEDLVRDVAPKKDGHWLVAKLNPDGSVQSIYPGKFGSERLAEAFMTGATLEPRRHAIVWRPDEAST